MAEIEVVSEKDAPAGWDFTINRAGGERSPQTLQMHLSWADYNLWSPGGADSPPDVAAAVVRFLLAHADGFDLPPRFDASVVRRRFADADKQLPGLIEPGH